MTRGGRRAGAGRPATGRTVRPVQFHLPPETIAAIDEEIDGTGMSRSQWVTMIMVEFMDSIRDRSKDTTAPVDE